MTDAPDAIIFDCDGVLVDTEACWTRAYAHLFATHGQALTSTDRHALIGQHLDVIEDILAARLHLPAGSRPAKRALALAENEMAQGIAAMPGATSLVRELHDQKPLAVASSSPAEAVARHLARLDIIDAFDAILGGDDVTRPKPAPDIYILACQRLGVAPVNAIAIEDTSTGAAAAKAAGLYVIGIPSIPHIRLNADCHARSLTDPRVRIALGLPRGAHAEQRSRHAAGLRAEAGYGDE